MVSEKMKDRYYKSAAAIGATLATVGAATPLALAEGETSAVDTAITGMATTVATQGQTTVSNVLPVIAPLIATILVATLGVKIVKRFAK